MSTWWIINGLLLLIGFGLAAYGTTHQTADMDGMTTMIFGGVILFIVGLVSSAAKVIEMVFL